ncbi:MAG: FIST C-terminal domain-containing protein [Polyangiaceae bacterium]|nr:FIST C-terminal domain-containing protein [Polyangiaceae bacterium]
MQVFQGKSHDADARRAVAEATAGFQLGGATPDLVLVFASTAQDPDALATALTERFPGAKVVGCTTAGEILDAGHAKGAVVVSAIVSPSVRWAVRAVEDLGALDEARAERVADELFAELGTTRDAADPARTFCLTLIDGLSMKEEHVVSTMADALGGLPLLGGSAGDDLAFRQTRVFVDGQARSGVAVFVLAQSALPFEIIKHQHYKATDRTVVITKADVANRRVYEMDGYPALEAYARALGLPPEAVDGDVCFMNPLLFVYGGENYVRSIQRVEPDGSIVFYCGVEEGMVLSLGGHEEMVGALDRDLAGVSAAAGKADLFIACNCILRALETDKRALFDDLGGVLAKTAHHVIGFDTYGEQLNGLHINQTLVGVALRGEARS